MQCPKCKKEIDEQNCGVIYTPYMNEKYCWLCNKVIEVSKMSKKELVKEVIELREEIDRRDLIYGG